MTGYLLPATLAIYLAQQLTLSNPSQCQRPSQRVRPHTPDTTCGLLSGQPEGLELEFHAQAQDLSLPVRMLRGDRILERKTHALE